MNDGVADSCDATSYGCTLICCHLHTKLDWVRADQSRAQTHPAEWVFSLYPADWDRRADTLSSSCVIASIHSRTATTAKPGCDKGEERDAVCMAAPWSTGGAMKRQLACLLLCYSPSPCGNVFYWETELQRTYIIQYISIAIPKRKTKTMKLSMNKCLIWFLLKV